MQPIQPPTPVSSAHFTSTLAAARDGNADAIEQLVEWFYPRVQAIVHRDLCRDLRRSRPWLTARFSTGDVVQEVFRSLLHDLSRFEGRTESAFCGYLAMITRNRLMDAIRFHEAAQRDGRRTSDWSDRQDHEGPEEDPVVGARTAEEALRLRSAMASFPERERLLLRARIEQQTSFHVLAENLGYSSKWAARRAFYATQSRLLILLGKHAST